MPETNTIPSLTPIVHRWMKDFITFDNLDPTLLAHGSPANIINPAILIENEVDFSSVLKAHGLKHLVCFARKANRSTGLVEAAKKGGFGIDVASYQELAQCIELGVEPKKIVITASIKPTPLLDLALKHGVLIIVDNKDEIEAIDTRCKELSVVAQLGIRVSGFYHNKEKLYSRFGFDINHVSEVIIKLIASNRNFNYQGLHFHLDGYSIPQRSAALESLIQLSDELRTQGIITSFIDIGGGFLIRYLQSEEEWITFRGELEKSLKQEQEEITFGNNGLGLEWSEGKFRGKLQTYPYYNDTNGSHFLDEILSTRSSSGERLSKLLNDRQIELRMEPGRALLNQVGFTASRVIFRKKDAQNNLLIGLEMNRSKMMSSSADFLIDPIILHQQPATKVDKAQTGYLVGGYCLEQDLILKRKLVFQKTPDIGDIICFPNTAGYFMHFYETLSHLYPLTPTLLIDSQNNARREHSIDSTEGKYHA